jgi:hypothetical protein
MSHLKWSLCRAGLLLGAGGKSIGLETIPRDRFSYRTALAQSWKDRMLLNLVKTRYHDLPIYLEVGRIVSGCSMETSVDVRGQVAKSGAGDTFAGWGASGTFTDRPTITYTPLTGEKFLQSFLTPIHPAKVFSLVQSGYAADFILELSVESLNGLRNRPVQLQSSQKDPPTHMRQEPALQSCVAHATDPALSQPRCRPGFRPSRLVL